MRIIQTPLTAREWPSPRDVLAWSAIVRPSLSLPGLCTRACLVGPARPTRQTLICLFCNLNAEEGRPLFRASFALKTLILCWFNRRCLIREERTSGLSDMSRCFFKACQGEPYGSVRPSRCAKEPGSIFPGNPGWKFKIEVGLDLVAFIEVPVT